MSVDAIINRVLDVEGDEYTNDPADSGGPTRWGITLDTLTEYRQKPCTPADVEKLTRAEAFNCYDWLFVQRPGFSRILQISRAIAEELIDTGVNCGPNVAIGMLQRCLNAFNQNGSKYPDVDVDYRMGPATERALQAFLAWRGTEGAIVLYKALNCLQGERYIHLAETRPKDERFVYGWLRERVGLSPEAA